MAKPLEEIRDDSQKIIMAVGDLKIKINNGEQIVINDLNQLATMIGEIATRIVNLLEQEKTEAAEAAEGVWQTAAEILNEQQYSIMWLRYGEELPIRQIAEQMGLSEENTRVILHRSRAQLAERMKESEGK